MTDIRVTCQTCGAVAVLRTDRILLLAVPDRTAGSYLFLCPSCAHLTVWPAGPADLRVLLAAGVRDAAESGGASHAGPLPPFTPDDLLDFHLLLASDEWLAELA